MTTNPVDTVATPDARRSWKWWLDLITTVALLAAVMFFLLDRSAVSRSRASSASSRPLPTEPIALERMPTVGSEDARIGMIVVADFECPACGQFAREEMPKITDRFIKTGKVLVAFSHFPLTRIHPNAADAALAADCAHDQRQFWPFHDAIFTHGTRLSRDVFFRQAEAQKLDMAGFRSCFDRPDRGVRVEEYLQIARNLGASGTPSFVIGTQSGRVLKATKRVDGGASADVLATELDAQLRETR